MQQKTRRSTTHARRLAGMRLGLLLALGLLMWPRPLLTAHAATLVVTSAGDGGPGSLRAAIAQAAPGDTITFAPGLGPITLTSGELVITQSLTIEGPVTGTQVLSGGGTSRILHIALAPGATVSPTVTLDHLTITDGHAPDATPASTNGSDGGGILNEGVLTLSNSAVMGNTAGAGASGGTEGAFGGNGGAGGGLANNGTVTITASSITDNTSGAGADGVVAGGFGGDGGGLLNRGVAAITASTVASNTTGSGGSVSDAETGFAGGGGNGGGIANLQGTLVLSTSTLADNATGVGGNAPPCAFCGPGSPEVGLGGNGAGLYTGYSLSDAGSVTITGSTISGNANGHGGSGGGGFDNSTFFSEGGGIMNDYESGLLTVTNSTIANNVASQGAGFFATGGSHITFSTIANNMAMGSASTAGGIFISRASDGGPVLGTSIVADNVASYAPDCYGPALGSSGYNLIRDTTRCPITGDATGNIYGQDPLLGPLAPNGGPTATQALLPGSPAIDAVPAARCTVATDQRGQPRPDEAADNGGCDIGAYESGPPALLANRAAAVPFQAVGLSGQGFAPAESLAVFWDMTDATPLTTVTTTLSGTFGVTITVPQAISGTHTLIAFGQTSGLSATTTLRVVPLLHLVPYWGPSGSTVTVAGAGFGNAQGVVLHWNTPTGPVLGTTTTSALGSFGGPTAIRFGVPATRLGTHLIYATGPSGIVQVISLFVVT